MKEQMDGVKWVLPEQVHVTLHFFGETAEEDLKKIEGVVQPLADQYSALHLGLGELGFFPNAHRPRVVWIGLKGETDKLGNLQRQIESGLGDAGFKLEDRSFHPHATFGRVKFQKGHREPMTADPIASDPHVQTFDKIVLFQSHLGTQGPRYEILKSFHLSGKPHA